MSVAPASGRVPLPHRLWHAARGAAPAVSAEGRRPDRAELTFFLLSEDGQCGTCAAISPSRIHEVTWSCDGSGRSVGVSARVLSRESIDTLLCSNSRSEVIFKYRDGAPPVASRAKYRARHRPRLALLADAVSVCELCVHWFHRARRHCWQCRCWRLRIGNGSVRILLAASIRLVLGTPLRILPPNHTLSNLRATRTSGISRSSPTVRRVSPACIDGRLRLFQRMRIHHPIAHQVRLGGQARAFAHERASLASSQSRKSWGSRHL
jgi:hypothetical protein